TNDPRPRTSLFFLKAGTRYEIQAVNTTDKSVLERATFTTWPAQPPVGKTVLLDKPGPIAISEGGTAGAWVRYTASPGTVIDGGEEEEAAITIENKAYVILENLAIRGGRRHGIRLKNVHHVIVRNCDIAGYGRIGQLRNGRAYDADGKPINYDAGVYLDGVHHLTIEHCYIHDPRNRANHWGYGHPLGPTGIFVHVAEPGGLVIRYNDIIGSQEHRWNDAIEGYGNGKLYGGPRCDADIYGNFLAFANDDGIELDGGQRNIRFYGNKIEGALCGISTAPNLVGPTFIHHNLVVNLGDERGFCGSVIKNGGGSTYSHGVSCFYHNTFVTAGKGISAVGFGRDKNRGMFLGISRNNIIMTTSAGIYDPYTPIVNDFDYDLFACPDGSEGYFKLSLPFENHAIFEDPAFLAPQTGDFRLRPDSPAKGSAVPVAGFHPMQAATENIPSLNRGAFCGYASYPFLPWRKVPAIPSATQLILDVPQETGKATATLTLKPVAGESQGHRFRILKNSVFDWLKVSPAEGELSPTEALTLSIEATSPKNTQIPLIPGAILIKFADGSSIPVTIYLRKVTTTWQSLSKAVNLKGHERFYTKTLGGLNSVFLDAPDSRNKDNPKLPSLDLEVETPVAGPYFIYVQVLCPQPGGNHDSLWLSINGAERQLCTVAPRPVWHWIRLAAGKSELFTLKKGHNTIRIFPREPLFLSAILVTGKKDLVTENPWRNIRSQLAKQPEGGMHDDP
ncbi:MAG: right-handed parallel beta-helix repeat-containing protein, partial [Lentisphaerae bacterium]